MKSALEFFLYAILCPNTEQQQQQQALFTFRFRIIIVTAEGSFSLTVSYMQCNERKTKNTSRVRKSLASK